MRERESEREGWREGESTRKRAHNKADQPPGLLSISSLHLGVPQPTYRIHNLWSRSSWRAHRANFRGTERKEDILIPNYNNWTSLASFKVFSVYPSCQSTSQKCMCIFMPPLKLEKELNTTPTLPPPQCTHICLKTEGSFTHMATWKENEILSQALWFFSSFSWVNECQMFSQRLHIFRTACKHTIYYCSEVKSP